MAWYRELKNKLAHLMGRSEFDDSLNEEMRSHLEMRADELVEKGMTREDALGMARREFGPTAALAEESREAWRWSWMEDLARDLRYAGRALVRDRRFAMTAVVSLALGIGVNTAVFSLAAAFLFSEPSARDAARLVRVEIGGRGQVEMREFGFLRDAGVFEELIGFNENAEINWRSGETSQRLFGVRVTENFWEVTRTPIALGRPMQAGERDTVVVSHRFWQNSLDGTAGALGRLMVLDGQPYTVVGILPPNHRTLIGLGFAPDLYVPVRTPTSRISLYGRLPEGVTREGILDKLKSACAQLDQVYPDGDMKWVREIRVTPVIGIGRFLQGNKSRRAFAAFFAMLTGVAGLLLMIACANVASLLLSRAAGRAREFAIRLSIGASRGRLVRQLLAESLLLSVMGAAAGLGLNLMLTNALNGMALPLPVPIRLAMVPDWRLLVYGAVIAVVSAVMAGLLPALTSTRPNVSLKRNEHQVSGNSGTLRKALVGGQLAVSVIVLVTAALFVRNLLRSATMNPGFDLERTSWAQMRLVPESYPNKEKTFALVGMVLDRVRALPGVESATFTNVVPLNDTSNDSGLVSSDVKAEGMRIRYFTFGVAEDYFRTMAIPIVAGRDFQSADRPGAPRVVILNEELARLVFGAVPAVGRTIRFGNSPRTVVGVAANNKYSTLGEDKGAAMYEPYLQRGGNRANLHFLIRASVPPATLSQPLNKVLLALEPNAAVEVKPMSQAMGFALLPSRAGAGLLGVIGALGLTLAAIGLYGVLSYAVSRRIGEIGVRLALGAQRGDVLRLVLGEGAWILGAGLTVGILISVFVTKPLAMFLVSGLEPSDPLTYGVVAAVLVGVGCVASVRPALRAMHADPVAALRCE